jgi:hypothetical protein
MISLIDLILELNDTEERKVWRTYANRFGSRNTVGQVRYFKNRDKATKFATGARKGPKMGRPKAKIKPRHKEEKQKYDYTPGT